MERVIFRNVNLVREDSEDSSRTVVFWIRDAMG